MVREFSAGGLVVRKLHGLWHLAVIVPRCDEAAKKAGKKEVLALPKGIIDQGERPEAAALREVREESGVEGELLQKLGDIKYVYVRSWGDGERVFKVVSFYLFRYVTGEIGEISSNMRHEVARAQ